MKYLLFAGSDYYPCGGWDDYRGAFDTLETNLFEQWKRAAAVDERERLHAKVSVLEDFRGSLETIRNDGERAQIELDADRA